MCIAFGHRDARAGYWTRVAGHTQGRDDGGCSEEEEEEKGMECKAENWDGERGSRGMHRRLETAQPIPIPETDRYL